MKRVKKIYEEDPWLMPYKSAIDERHDFISRDIEKVGESTCHLWYPLHKEVDEWILREWAPSASRIYLIGDFNNWKKTDAYQFKPVGQGNWELRLPDYFLSHGDLYKLFIEWPGGGAERIPAYATRVVQDPETKVFSAQVWDPKPYLWKYRKPNRKAIKKNLFIYECHIGMSSAQEKVASFEDFRRDVLPRVKALGYNAIQVMALQEHPYYGSFGYQVSSIYALSSRFGTPEEFKALVDDAHSKGIAVIMDIVHSHSVKNEAEGLSRFDGDTSLYFYKGAQGYHPAWDSRCFDYGKDEVKHYLISNCKYWLEEYHIDGFRFDGVTSMMYWDHGLGKDFTGYDDYFSGNIDTNALSYLAMANLEIHKADPDAITIAEDVSGMPGLAAPFECGGIGFDFRLAMGIADHWIKWIKEKRDEEWSVGEMWYELTNKRAEEKSISYAECHDQALVGDKTLIFRLIDSDMYFAMNRGSNNLRVDRGVALHKMIRLVTAATAGNGYLNFMGNEFGHPEWIDFPREGNEWSYKYARRNWPLVDDGYLRYSCLNTFDAEMVHFLKASRCFDEAPSQLYINDTNKVLVFRRKEVIFVFNFNPSVSYADFRFQAPEGIYETAFTSDEKRFDGFDRVKPGERHHTIGGDLSLYIPCRCALVLKKIAGSDKTGHDK